MTKDTLEAPVHSGFKLAVVVSFLTGAFASAQTFEQITNVRLDSPPSSVRSTAMGGTTAATTNDVSVLADNPIAASDIRRVTLSLAASNATYPTEAFGTTGNLGYTYRDHVDATGLSNFSIAAPFGNAVLGAYYRGEPRLQSHEPLSFRSRADQPYESPACTTCAFFFGPTRTFDRRDTRYGVTLSWKLRDFVIGGGAEMQQLDERAAVARTVLADFANPTYERIFRTTKGQSIVPSAAIAWTPSSRIVVAASYHGAGSFDRTTSVCATVEGNAPLCSTQLALLNQFRQRQIASYRGGVSINIAQPLTVTAELVRRQYSAYSTEPFSIINTHETLPYHDVTETHAGAEYRLGSLALRAGWWHDPARFNDTQFAPYAFWGQPANHLTFGAGLKVSNAEVSFAVDDPRNDNGRRAAVGLTYSF